MAMLVWMNFPTARRAAMQGHAIRRKEWTDKWWRYSAGGWWVVEGAADPRLMEAGDCEEEDLLALDWTVVAPACVDEAEAAANGSSCLAGYDPETGEVTDPSAGSSGGSSGDGGSSSDEGVLPDYPSSAPITTGGGAAGSGGGGSGGRSPRPDRDPVTGSPPTLSLDLEDMTEEECYAGGESTQEASIGGTVALGSATGSYDGLYFVTVRYGSRVVFSTTLAPGGSASFSAVDVRGVPGESVFTFEARAWKMGVSDLAASDSITMKDWCPIYECGAPGFTDGGSISTQTSKSGVLAIPPWNPETHRMLLRYSYGSSSGSPIAKVHCIIGGFVDSGCEVIPFFPGTGDGFATQELEPGTTAVPFHIECCSDPEDTERTWTISLFCELEELEGP